MIGKSVMKYENNENKKVVMGKKKKNLNSSDGHVAI